MSTDHLHRDVGNWLLHPSYFQPMRYVAERGGKWLPWPERPWTGDVVEHRTNQPTKYLTHGMTHISLDGVDMYAVEFVRTFQPGVNMVFDSSIAWFHDWRDGVSGVDATL